MTFVGDLAGLAAELKMQQQLFQRNTFSTTSAQIYANLANVLDRGREACEAETTLPKLEPSVQLTVEALTTAMEELSDLVKDLAEVREGYVKPQGAGSVAQGIEALEAARKPHAAVRQGLKELVRNLEKATESVTRYAGAANSSQEASEERSYRAVSTRMEREYRRGLRRSG